VDAAAGGMWVQQLPLKGDTIEAKAVHKQLLGFIQSSDPRWVGGWAGGWVGGREGAAPGVGTAGLLLPEGELPLMCAQENSWGMQHAPPCHPSLQQPAECIMPCMPHPCVGLAWPAGSWATTRC
jgi:hypothetical protein